MVRKVNNLNVFKRQDQVSNLCNKNRIGEIHLVILCGGLAVSKQNAYDKPNNYFDIVPQKWFQWNIVAYLLF